MSWLISDLTNPREFLIPRIVGSTKASQPATETISSGVDPMIIPVPDNVIAGDLLFAIVFVGLNFHTSPPGWLEIMGHPAPQTGNPAIDFKVAGINEPASYTWDAILSSQRNLVQTGCMIAIRDANPTLGDSQPLSGGGFTVPALTNNIENSILVGFSAVQANSDVGNNIEQYTANAPLIEQIEHISEAPGGYIAIRQACIIGVEEGLSVGVISGRSFSHPNIAIPGDPVNFGIIVEGY